MGYRKIRLLLSSLLFGFAIGLSQLPRVNLQDSFPVVQVGNQLWIGTPSGLYQYDQNDDSFKLFSLPGPNPSAPVRRLFYHQEWLWCVLDSGLAGLQVRLNDWLFFDSQNGLPSDRVTGLGFQDDYVWASTPEGFARFDQLIEQWERFDEKRGLPDKRVSDLLANDRLVWMITGGGFSQYDPQFEKWRHFAVSDSAGIPLRLFQLPNELWVVSERGLTRFLPQLQRQQTFFLPYLDAESLIDLYISEERIWAITREGIFIYEQQSGVWREFEGNSELRGLEILGGQIGVQDIWILSPRITMVWDRTLKNWEYLDYSSGLSSTGYAGVNSDGELSLLFQPDHLEYRRTSRSPWRRHQFTRVGGSGTGENALAALFDNPEGGRINLGENLWTWQGTRITLVENGSRVSSSDPGLWDRTSAQRLDIKSQLNFSQARRIAGFYDNVDYSETKYGVRYRGNDSDLVREVTWGDFRRDAGTMPFAQPAEIFGAAGWLQYGPKTERFKRTLFTAKGTTGEVRSQRTYEHVVGSTVHFADTVLDREYLHNQFFSVPGLDTVARPPVELVILVDDHVGANNTTATVTGGTAGGVAGDFDAWVPVEDFYYYAKGASVRLLKPISSSWTIVARYTIDGVAREVVLLDGVTSTAQDNVYYAGAQGIIPWEYRLSVLDSTGRELPLSQLGLDLDGDGYVDPSRIDYERGLLLFPSPRPFPPGAYDPVAPTSTYRLISSGTTELPTIRLTRENLVRGSETVWLDGIPAAAGNDYLLDYTNGTLLFVREGIVGPETRIEIEYEYYRTYGSRLDVAGLQFSPSDQLYVQGDWQKSSSDSTHLFSLHGEIREQLGTFDLRILPGIAYQTLERVITGANIDAYLSSDWFRFQSKYENYDPAYRNLYRPQSVVGDIRRRFQFFSSIDILQDLRLTGEWKDITGNDSSSSTGEGGPTDRTGTASLLLHSQDLPGINLIYQSGRTSEGDSTTGKHFGQGLVEYQLPRTWSDVLHLKNLRLEYFLKLGQQSLESSVAHGTQGFMQTYYRLNALITEQFQAGLFYRKSTLDDLSTSDRPTPISGYDRFLLDLAFGEWRALLINARVENTLQEFHYRTPTQSTYLLRQFLQTNFRFSPGYLWEELSPLFFEFTLTQGLNQTGELSEGGSSLVWRVTPIGQENAETFQRTKTYFIKNEFRPSASWFIQSIVEWNNQEVGASWSRLDRHYWRLNEKVDYKLTFETRLVAQYKQASENLGFDRVIRTREPSLWVEHRWSQDLTTITQLLFRRTENDNGIVEGYGDDWGVDLDLTWRKGQFLGFRYIEVRESISGAFHEAGPPATKRSYEWGSSTALDLYPLHSVILRVRLDLNRYVDEVLPDRSFTGIAWSAKLMLQL
jgi:hypothetical protein